MTNEDAIKVLIVAGDADGGCSNCVLGCIETATRQWPEIDWKAIAKSLPESTPESHWPDPDLAFIRTQLEKVLND